MIVGTLFLSMVLLDQITKAIVRDGMFLGQSIPVLGNFLRLTYVENPGIAFGIRVGNSGLFTVLSVIASIGIIVYLVIHWKEPRGIRAGLALILGGAFGNLIDRIRFGQVVDFIDVGIRDVRWPVFNVADSAVVVGMFVFVLTAIVVEKKRKAEKEPVAESN